MRTFRVIVNGLAYEVSVEEVGEAEEAKTPELPKRSPSPEPARRTPATPAPSPPEPPAVAVPGGDAVAAPLPGTVLEVKVGLGDEVAEGQVLLVLEAMKMENEITSPRRGKVVEVHVQKGAGVGVGDPMITLA